jgi:hypothetical protein
MRREFRSDKELDDAILELKMAVIAKAERLGIDVTVLEDRLETKVLKMHDAIENRYDILKKTFEQPEKIESLNKRSIKDERVGLGVLNMKFVGWVEEKIKKKSRKVTFGEDDFREIEVNSADMQERVELVRKRFANEKKARNELRKEKEELVEGESYYYSSSSDETEVEREL